MSSPSSSPATTDLDIGDRFSAGPVALSSADARTVVDLLGYTHPLFAGDGPPPMLPGQVLLALMAGALESSGHMGADVAALVGMNDIVFPSPLAPGDAVRVDVHVIDRRQTRGGDHILLDLGLRALHVDREVATATARFLLRTN